MDFDFEVSVTVNKLLLPLMSDEAVADVDEVIYTFTCNYHKNEVDPELEQLISGLEKAVEKLNKQDSFVCAYNQAIFALNQELLAMQRTNPTSYQTIYDEREKLKEAYQEYIDRKSNEPAVALDKFCVVIQQSYDKLSTCKKQCRNALIPLAILGALVFAALVAAIVMAFILVPPGAAGAGVGLGLCAAAHASGATAATTAAVATVTAAKTAAVGGALLDLLPASCFPGLVFASFMQLPWFRKLTEYKQVSRSLQALGTFQTTVTPRNEPAPVVTEPSSSLVLSK
jgi:hypothetical protein